MTSTSKPLASLSLDLDNKWSYLKTRGDAAWETFPSYLDQVVPRILELHRELGLKITVFIVGQDAVLPKNASALKAIADAGHEIGNHSFHHEPWLHLYSREQLIEEFSRTELALRELTGQVPTGFRGPGFSFSSDVLNVLNDRGYQYDCSTFPTFLGPVARAYYFFKTNLNGAQREQRKALFGSIGDGFQPLKPYRWKTDKTPMLEIPVTTMPVSRAPFHLSYIMFLARWSEKLAIWYFELSLWLCRMRGIEPSILLHPLDFMGCDDDADLAFFPAMDLPSEKKLRVMRKILTSLSQTFRVVTMREHAAAYADRQVPVKAIPARG